MPGPHSAGAPGLRAFALSAATAPVGVRPRQSPAAAPIEPPTGHHAATASAAALAGLRIHAGRSGLAWRRESENVLPPDFFMHPDARLVDADWLAHEFARSWNGRLRQSADLWTADLNVPVRDSLPWVYEGQTPFRAPARFGSVLRKFGGTMARGRGIGQECFRADVRSRRRAALGLPSTEGGRPPAGDAHRGSAEPGPVPGHDAPARHRDGPVVPPESSTRADARAEPPDQKNPSAWSL